MDMPAPEFFKRCAFVCIDVQGDDPPQHMTEKDMPKEWKGFGFSAADVNAAVDYTYKVAYPNCRLVADACRVAKLPMIFVHWGCLFHDGMDLDPAIRRSFLDQFGTDYDQWGHHLNDPSSKPAQLLGIRSGEYVLPKSGQDAFASSNLGFVLQNLGGKNIVFVGGHTGACLGKTAASAKRLGYNVLVVQDATFNATQSDRVRCINEVGYDYVVMTPEFVKVVHGTIATNRAK